MQCVAHVSFVPALPDICPKPRRTREPEQAQAVKNDQHGAPFMTNYRYGKPQCKGSASQDRRQNGASITMISVLLTRARTMCRAYAMVSL